jgi:hypothetical protein
MFRNFPKIGYVLDNKILVATDIFRRIKLSSLAENELLLVDYTIEAGQRPEDVADILYDDPKLYWTVLLVNDIVDPYNEWYYSPEQLEALVEDKYGAGNGSNTHHWITLDNPLVCVEYDTAKLAAGEIKEVSHLEHEQYENDARQDISVVNPKFIQDFLTEFNRLINE